MMVGNMVRGGWRRVGFVMLGFVVGFMMLPAAVYSADAPARPADWNKVVEAAKKEGRIVISGDSSEAWRKTLVDLFREEYPGITVEYTGMNGRDFWPRVRKERQMGQKLWDLRAGGTTSALPYLAEGLFDPIRPLLLPEIADDSKWVGGVNGIFNDKENKYLPTYALYIERPVYVNRDFIKESELKSSGQLLDPKFKGLMVMQNPTGGVSFQSLANLAFMYGEDYLRDLLTKQNVAVTDDNRQQAEWVVRGKYPIALGLIDTQLIPFVKQGLGKNIKMLEDKITPAGTGFGGISLLKDAPHPNAARVYINWLLSQKTQMQLSKNVFLNSRRTDVPVVDKVTAVDPTHLSNYRFHTTEENVEISNRLLPLVRQLVRK